jgi:hypothetical protein
MSMSIERADGTCKSQHHVEYDVGVLLHRRAVPDAVCRQRSAGRRRHRVEVLLIWRMSTGLAALHEV